MSEANLWEWLRDVALPLGQYTRIESEISPGFPDVHCQIPGALPFTMELKWAQRHNARVPFTDDHGMRRSQVRWIKENLKNGGTVWIIAEATPDIFIIEGKHAGEINYATREGLFIMAEKVLQSRGNAKYAARYFHKLFVGEDP